MEKITLSKCFRAGGLLLLVLFVVSCAPTKNSYENKYNKVWKEIVTSDAWKNSLVASTGIRSMEDLKSSTSLSDMPTLNGPVSERAKGRIFGKKYHSLVSRAYYKIIAEAENADIRLKLEYERWNLKKYAREQEKDSLFVQDLEQVNIRYQAHKDMLMGLRSWNIFSDNRTGDLEYFKRENVQEVYLMYEKGVSDDTMVDFLVFKLADLYHAGI